MLSVNPVLPSSSASFPQKHSPSLSQPERVAVDRCPLFVAAALPQTRAFLLPTIYNTNGGFPAPSSAPGTTLALARRIATIETAYQRKKDLGNGRCKTEMAKIIKQGWDAAKMTTKSNRLLDDYAQHLDKIYKERQEAEALFRKKQVQEIVDAYCNGEKLPKDAMSICTMDQQNRLV